MHSLLPFQTSRLDPTFFAERGIWKLRSGIVSGFGLDVCVFERNRNNVDPTSVKFQELEKTTTTTSILSTTTSILLLLISIGTNWDEMKCLLSIYAENDVY